MTDPFAILLKPVITEKATNLQTADEPQYTFRVRISANKNEIKNVNENENVNVNVYVNVNE